MKRYLAAAAAAATLTGLAGCAAAAQASQESASRTLSGTFTLEGGSYSDRWQMGRECSGSGGYDDVRAGAPVVVYDAGGAIIASSSLDAGSPAQGPDDERQDEVWARLRANALETSGIPRDTEHIAHGSKCTFPFTVANVPTSEFYQVEVSHRGRLTYSRADLDASGWILPLTLGD